MSGVSWHIQVYNIRKDEQHKKPPAPKYGEI